jgi:superfamily II DNA/RNA helicase
MKNKLLTLQNNLQVSSCGVCHPNTIEQGWCANCIDQPNIHKYTLNPPQTEVYNILEENPKQSLIIATRTGTGKTWCAYQAIRKYYESGSTGKILWINPLKQIVREKVAELQETFPHKKILELSGDTSDAVGFGSRRNMWINNSDVIVMSYEMLDSITRKPALYNSLNDVGMLIIDEIHSIGDYSRGGKLDGSVTRFLLSNKKVNHHVQVVALSATFDNIDELAKYFEQFTPIKTIISQFSPIHVNVDKRLHLYGREGALPVFVEEVGKYLNRNGGILAMQLSIPGCIKLADLLNQAYGPNTARVHNSELEKESRIQNVDDFNEGKFKVMCCTPTLLAGVNLSTTVLIINLSFFNPLTMEPDVLPPTSIKQAVGRVGRPPKYNEGYVSYICNKAQEQDVLEALNAPNIIAGALNSELSQVLNIEIALGSHTVDSLREWYKSTYSGYSSNVSDDRYAEEIKFLTEHNYASLSPSSQLSSLAKGKSCVKNFVNPPFLENCITLLSNSKIENTAEVSTILSELLALPHSPSNWNDRKAKQLDDSCNFDWLYNENHRIDFNRNQPRVQWADPIEFAMRGIASVAADLKLGDLQYNAAIIHAIMADNLIPVPLAVLKLKIDALGVRYLGKKWLYYLALNGVRSTSTGITGPDVFRTPVSANYISNDDAYTNIEFSDTSSRFDHMNEIIKGCYKSDISIKTPISDENSEW